MAELAASQVSTENTFQRFMESTNARFNTLETVQAQMLETQARHETTIAQLAQTQSVMQRDLDSMKGDRMEMRLQGRIHGLLATRLGMRKVRVARALYPAGDLPAFLSAVHYAEERDDITEEQYTRLMYTDLIASARRCGSTQEVYVPVEVSNRLDHEDVDRAVKSAGALVAVYPDAEVLPAVYGSEMSEQDRLYANGRGVEVFLMRSQR